MLQSVSILICTHNRADLLRQTLQSLAELRVRSVAAPPVPVELLVVANACTDDTQSIVELFQGKLPFAVRCIAEPVPGLSRARNVAVNQSTGELCVFLDDDVWVEPDWLEKLLELYDQHPADFAGGKVNLWWQAISPPGWFRAEYNWIFSGNDHGDQIKAMTSPIGAIGANFSFKRKVYETIGGFRLELGRSGTMLMGGEESEFLARAIAAGFKGFYTPFSVVKHWVAPHRVSNSYFCGVMAGNAEARIYAKPTFGPSIASRALVGHLFLILRHSAGLLVARAGGDADREIHHRIYRAAGKGGLRGSLRRLRRGSEKMK